MDRTIEQDIVKNRGVWFRLMSGKRIGKVAHVIWPYFQTPCGVLGSWNWTQKCRVIEHEPQEARLCKRCARATEWKSRPLKDCRGHADKTEGGGPR